MQLKFYYGTAPFYLFDAATLYITLAGQQIPEIAVLQAWFFAKFPDVFVHGSDKQMTDLVARARKLDPNDYQLFLELINRLSE